MYFSLTPFPLELQYAIISTIYFLTEFYSYRPTIHLRHIYLRWNLGEERGGRGGGGRKRERERDGTKRMEGVRRYRGEGGWDREGGGDGWRRWGE